MKSLFLESQGPEKLTFLLSAPPSGSPSRKNGGRGSRALTTERDKSSYSIF